MGTASGKPREEIITRLAQHIDGFERYWSPHSRLMADLATRLAFRLGLPPTDISAIAEAALLHDIGLYQMSPPYLSNPGPLSLEERMDLWRHPIIGEQEMAKRGSSRHAQLLVRWHHEWWNGTGYPDRLSFEHIPIGARIIRAVELHSALTSDRPYRTGLPDGLARDVLRSSAGVECDPYIVTALLALLDEVSPVRPAAPPPLEMPDKPADQPLASPEANLAETREPESAPPVSEASPRSETSPGVTDVVAADAPTHQTPTEARPSEAGDALQGGAAEGPEAQPAHTAEPSAEIAPVSGPNLAVDQRGSGSFIPISDQPLPFRSQETAAEAPAAPPPLDKSIPVEEPVSTEWREWLSSSNSTAPLLGFEASVLRQVEFRSIAIALSGWGHLGWYLKAWGKQIQSNDPRRWAAAASQAILDPSIPLTTDQISEVLYDSYVPGARLSNPALRKWFGETDSWWLDNLRRKLDEAPAPLRDRLLLLGLQTGDYAQSFSGAASDIKRPLTTAFRELADRLPGSFPGHPGNRMFNLPVEQFIATARVDLLFLNLPAGQYDATPSGARAEWREAWVSGAADNASSDSLLLVSRAQSKQAYLEIVDRLMSAGRNIRKWAIECRDVGLASASDISEMVKRYRPVHAVYSKDLTEVAGGLRHYIIVANLE